MKKSYKISILGQDLSVLSDSEDEEVANLRMLDVWHKILENEIRYKEYSLEDAEIAVVGGEGVLERGRVPQTPHALAPDAFDSIMV